MKTIIAGGIPVLKQWARDENNKKRGLLIAYAEGTQVKIGYSFCNSGDNFSGMNEQKRNEMTEKIAFGRAACERHRRIHHNRTEIYDFVSRAKRYFKDKKLPIWANEMIDGE